MNVLKLASLILWANRRVSEHHIPEESVLSEMDEMLQNTQQAETQE